MLLFRQLLTGYGYKYIEEDKDTKWEEIITHELSLNSISVYSDLSGKEYADMVVLLVEGTPARMWNTDAGTSPSPIGRISSRKPDIHHVRKQKTGGEIILNSWKLVGWTVRPRRYSSMMSIYNFQEVKAAMDAHGIKFIKCKKRWLMPRRKRGNRRRNNGGSDYWSDCYY